MRDRNQLLWVGASQRLLDDKKKEDRNRSREKMQSQPAQRTNSWGFSKRGKAQARISPLSSSLALTTWRPYDIRQSHMRTCTSEDIIPRVAQKGRHTKKTESNRRRTSANGRKCPLTDTSGIHAHQERQILGDSVTRRFDHKWKSTVTTSHK